MRSLPRRMPRRPRSASRGTAVLVTLGALVLSAVLPACTTYKDELARSQRAFEENQHERALAVLRMLETDTRHLDPNQRARYAYLRGMTDFRVGYKNDARHWLALAKAMDEKSPGLLPAEWRGRLDQAIAELNVVVFATGMESLTNAKARPIVRAKRPAEAVEEAPVDEEEAVKPEPKKKKKPAVDEDE